MQVYNFYATLDIDGRQSQLTSGPRRADGGLRGSIKIRSEGDILTAVRIEALALKDGRLELRVYPDKDCADKVEQMPEGGIRIVTER
jgi:hypothetical protein